MKMAGAVCRPGVGRGFGSCPGPGAVESAVVGQAVLSMG
jgi:hypothetical protein